MIAIETGGRWSDEAADFIELLATARAQAVPPHLQRVASLAWQRRWMRLLSVACAFVLSSALLQPAGSAEVVHPNGETPDLVSVLVDAAAGAGTAPIRAPLRG